MMPRSRTLLSFDWNSVDSLALEVEDLSTPEVLRNRALQHIASLTPAPCSPSMSAELDCVQLYCEYSTPVTCPNRRGGIIAASCYLCREMKRSNCTLTICRIKSNCQPLSISSLDRKSTRLNS